MLDNLSFTKITAENFEEFEKSFVACYRLVFATKPWREWQVCPQCGRKWGLETAELNEIATRGFLCPECNILTQDFWPSNKVEEDLRKEILKQDVSCWVAHIEDRVIAFALGYSITPAELEVKLKLPGLTRAINHRFNFPDRIIYQDELGVAKEFRGQKIAKQLFLCRLKDFLNTGIYFGTIRTMTDPPSITYKWFMNKLKYSIIDEYHDEDKRVIMAQDLREVAGLAGL